MLVMLGVALLFGIPLAIVLGSAAAVSRDLLSMGMFIVSIAVMAVVLYLAFALDAVFVSRVGPLQAVKNSVAVVRGSFWANREAAVAGAGHPDGHEPCLGAARPVSLPGACTSVFSERLRGHG